MPYANIVFVKLEKRLLNDPRWYMLSEHAQLNFIKFILFAAETYNKIPKNIDALRKAFKAEQTNTEIESTILEIKGNFPKFKENKHFYYFEGFEEKTNYVKPKEIPRKSKGTPMVGTEEEKEEEKEKEEDKRKSHFVLPSLENVDSYIKTNALNVDSGAWFDFYQSKGWMVGRNKMKDWQAAVRTWDRKNKDASLTQAQKNSIASMKRLEEKWKNEERDIQEGVSDSIASVSE